MNPEYINLKDLPGAPAGTVWTNDKDYNQYYPKGVIGELSFTEEYLKAHPEWFAIVKRETMVEAVSMFLEKTKFMAISVRSKDEGDRYSNCYRELRAAYQRELEREKSK